MSDLWNVNSPPVALAPMWPCIDQLCTLLSPEPPTTHIFVFLSLFDIFFVSVVFSVSLNVTRCTFSHVFTRIHTYTCTVLVVFRPIRIKCVSIIKIPKISYLFFFHFVSTVRSPRHPFMFVASSHFQSVSSPVDATILAREPHLCP